jgi:hypothetical protein
MKPEDELGGWVSSAAEQRVRECPNAGQIGRISDEAGQAPS